MAKVITFINQKGGVGKTTTALNVGGGLKKMGFSVLFIDMDPQCNLSLSLKGKLKVASSRELLTEEVKPEEAIQHLKEGDLVPGSANLSTMDMELNTSDRALKMQKPVKYYRDLYDYIIIDTPPTLGIVTVNVLGVTDEVVIPVLYDIFSLQGTAQLFRTIYAVRGKINPKLRINGILRIADYEDEDEDNRVEQAFEKIAKTLETRIYKTTIVKSAKVKKAVIRGGSIFAFEPECEQAKAFSNLINEIHSI